jgi:DNA polymerase-3 subunit beta
MNTFEINSAQLYDLCKQANQAVKKNALIPILECFKIDVSSDSVVVSATNLEHYLEVRSDIDTNVDQDFSLCPSADIFLKTLSTINPPQQITVSCDSKSITIKTQEGEYESGASDPMEYPTKPISPEGGLKSEVNSSFTNAFDMVSNCCGNDPMKMAFTGVLLEQRNDELKVVSTNSSILAKYSSEDSFNEDLRVLIPSSAQVFLKNNFVTDYSISITPKHAIFTDDHTHYSVRLIDSKFPDYNAIIPKDSPFTATINKFELISVLKRVSIYADKFNQIVMRFSDGTVNISSHFDELNNRSNENLRIDYDGDNLAISFNYNLLFRVLSSIQGDEIDVKLIAKDRAAIITSTREDNKSLHLIMPTYVQ